MRFSTREDLSDLAKLKDREQLAFVTAVLASGWIPVGLGLILHVALLFDTRRQLAVVLCFSSLHAMSCCIVLTARILWWPKTAHGKFRLLATLLAIIALAIARIALAISQIGIEAPSLDLAQHLGAPCRALASLFFLASCWLEGDSTSNRVNFICMLGAAIAAAELNSELDDNSEHMSKLEKYSLGFDCILSCAIISRCLGAVLCANSSSKGRWLLLGATTYAAAIVCNVFFTTLVPLYQFDIGLECIATTAFTLDASRLLSLQALSQGSDMHKTSCNVVPALTPLLVASSRGGVQSLGWFKKNLLRDSDGDVAHDFWEAVSNGLFARMTI